jgi:GNAT superfamily N-acetyltransferase
MRVRTATAKDRNFILGLSGRFAESPLPPWLPAEIVTSGTMRQLDDALSAAGPRSELLVAETDDGTPLGFAWVLLLKDFFTAADYCKISEIATAQDGTGAGAMLMKACEVWARDRGCANIMLNVLRDNAHARAFYEGLGYEPEYTAMTKVISKQATDPPG